MAQSSNFDSMEDLQFKTEVDSSVVQHVPMENFADAAPQWSSTATDKNTDQTESEYGQEGYIERPPPAIFNESSHPIVCIFHCLFKLLALILYIFGGFFTGGSHKGSHFIIITVFCILLLSADFWVVKNITGRLLVGLRWWNMVSDDGQSTRWVFESAENARINKFDSTLFWTVLYATPALWMIFFFIALIKFELGWIITVVMGFTLGYANVYGYYRCSSDQKVKFQNMMNKGAELGMTSAIPRLLGFFTQQTQNNNRSNFTVV